MNNGNAFPWAPIYSWSNVILHLDADAFFASVMQAANPSLRGKPVIVGRERGLATAFSYEAKARGVHRGMLSHEIKKICPDAVFVDSDFALFQLYSKKMFDIARQFSPEMEIYSIDEGFLDIKGMRRPLALGYLEIGATIQQKVKQELSISISVGISLTKSLAKLASGFAKPNGLTMIPGKKIPEFLAKVPIGDVWGIGHQTSTYLKKLGIHTALDFACKPESFFLNGRIAKPYREIWYELRGIKINDLNTSEKESYKSISRTETFSPASDSKSFLLSQVMSHVEDSFAKARNLKYLVGKMHIFLKTQRFVYHSTEIKLAQKTNLPFLIRKEILEAFERIYKEKETYRAAGCTISDLHDDSMVQQGLFTEQPEQEEKLKKIYSVLKNKQVAFGSILHDRTAQKKEIKPLSRVHLSITNR